MLVEYLFAFIAVTVLKIQKITNSAAPFYRGLFLTVVGVNIVMLHILFMSDILSIHAARLTLLHLEGSCLKD